MPARGALVLVATCLTGGCALVQAPMEDPFADPDEGTIRVEARNRNIEDAVVYALRDDVRHRLGVVPGLGESSFKVEWPRGKELRFVIDLTVGPACVTRLILARPGDVITLEIESDLLADPECFPLGPRGGREAGPAPP